MKLEVKLKKYVAAALDRKSASTLGLGTLSGYVHTFDPSIMFADHGLPPTEELPAYFSKEGYIEIGDLYLGLSKPGKLYAYRKIPGQKHARETLSFPELIYLLNKRRATLLTDPDTNIRELGKLLGEES